MKNIEILEKAFNKIGYEVDEDYRSEDSIGVMLNLCEIETLGIFNEDDFDDLDYVPQNLHEIYEINDHVLCRAEENILANHLEKYRTMIPAELADTIESYEGSLYDLREYLDDDMYYELSNAYDEYEKEIREEFDKFVNDFESALWNANREAIIAENEEKNEVIYTKYGRPDWDKEKDYSYRDFIWMCAGDACAIPGLLRETIENEMNPYERVIDFTILENNGRKYFVKTDDNRVLCLNELM